MYIFFSVYDYDKDGHLDGHEIRLAFLNYEGVDNKSEIEDIDQAEMEVYIDKTLLEGFKQKLTT